jgi:hypothetical protein
MPAAKSAHEIPGRNFRMVKYGQAPLNCVKQGSPAR